MESRSCYVSSGGIPKVDYFSGITPQVDFWSHMQRHIPSQRALMAFLCCICFQPIFPELNDCGSLHKPTRGTRAAVGLQMPLGLKRMWHAQDNLPEERQKKYSSFQEEASISLFPLFPQPVTVSTPSPIISKLLWLKLISQAPPWLFDKGSFSKPLWLRSSTGYGGFSFFFHLSLHWVEEEQDQAHDVIKEETPSILCFMLLKGSTLIRIFLPPVKCFWFSFEGALNKIKMLNGWEQVAGYKLEAACKNVWRGPSPQRRLACLVT